MVLAQKQCEMILGNFQAALRQNPDTKAAPYIEAVIATFGSVEVKYNRKIAANLVLNLYGFDVAALRKDLCKLCKLKNDLYKVKEYRFDEPSKAERTMLLRSLYGALTVYNEAEDDFKQFFTVDYDSDIHRQRYFIEKKYEQILSEFKENVCSDKNGQNTDADFTLYIQRLMLAAEFTGLERRSANSVISVLLRYLYIGELDSLERDITKIKVFKPAKAAPKDRQTLLCYLYDALLVFIGQDFSDIFALCDKVEALERQQ